MAKRRENTNEIDGHDLLTSHIGNYYPGMKLGEIKDRISTDSQMFDRALRIYHTDNYPEMEFMDFRTNYLKKFGHPLGDEYLPSDLREFREDEVAEGNLPPESKLEMHPNRDTYNKWAAMAGQTPTATQEEISSGIPGLISPDIKLDFPEINYSVDDLPSNPHLLPGEALETLGKEIKIQQEQDSYEYMNSGRLVRSDLTADQFYPLMLSPDDPVVRRMYNRSPVERSLGTKKGEETLSSFESKMAWLNDEVNHLTNGVNYIDRQLKNEYGENVFEALESGDSKFNNVKIAVSQNPLWEKRRQFVDLYNRNIEQSKGYITRPEFEPVRRVMAAQQHEQFLMDLVQETGTYNINYSPTGNMLTRALGKVIGSAGALMDAAEEMVGKDENYTGWDMTEDYLRNLTRDINSYYAPAPTSAQRPGITKQAPWKYKNRDVVIDFDDNNIPVAMRTQKGNLIPFDFSSLTPSEKLSLNTLTPKNKINRNAMIQKTGEVIADLGVQVALTRGIGSLGSGIGLSQKASGFIGVMGSTAGQMFGGVYDEMEKTFGEGDKAAQSALLISLGIGAASNIFNMEAKLAGYGKNAAAKAAGSAAKELPNLSAAAITGRAVRRFIQSGAEEAVEETVVEKVIQDGVVTAYGGKPEAVNYKELGETAMISFAVGLLGGSVDAAQSTRFEIGLALEQAAKNPEKYEIQLKEALNREIIPTPENMSVEEFAASERDKLLDIKKQMDAFGKLPPNLDKGKFALLLNDKRQAVAELNNLKNLNFSKEQIERAENKINAINRTIEKALRTGEIDVVTVNAKPSPDQKFLTEPIPIESTVEESVQPLQLDGREATQGGRIGKLKDLGSVIEFKSKDGLNHFVFPKADQLAEHGVKLLPEGRAAEPTLVEEIPPGPVEEISPEDRVQEEMQAATREEIDAHLEESATDRGYEESLIPEDLRDLFAEADVALEDVDLEPEEQRFENRLQVREGLDEVDFTKAATSELEKFMEGVDDPEIDEMLRNFRKLPEHPDNYNRQDLDEGQIAELEESFNRHKTNLIGELYEWTAMESSDVNEARSSDPDGRQLERNEGITEVAQELDDKGWDDLAAEAVKLSESFENSDADIDALAERTMNLAMKEDPAEELEFTPSEAESALETTSSSDQSYENLVEKNVELDREIATLNRQLVKDQQIYQEEAMDMLDMYGDMDVSAYIRDQTAPLRQKIKALRQKQKQLEKLIDERKPCK